MRTTNLVLFEGLPGSGKSTSGQRLAVHLDHLGIAARWWHEEHPGHPLYPFDDQTSLQHFLAALETERQLDVIAGVIDRWRSFAAGLVRSGEVAVLDSCLFVYATLCLFRADAPADVITAYLAEVEQAIAPARPCVVSFVQPDVATALRRICDERGPELEAYWIGAAERSRRGQRLGLQGFEGLVAFWTAHRALADAALRRLPFPKLELDTVSRTRGDVEATLLDFLGLPSFAEVALTPAEAARFTGTYVRRGETGEERCDVGAEAGRLYLQGLQGIWPRAWLLPAWRPADADATRHGPSGSLAAPATFHVVSWPIRVAFATDEHGGIRTMTAGDHRWRRSARTFVRA